MNAASFKNVSRIDGKSKAVPMLIDIQSFHGLQCLRKSGNFRSQSFKVVEN